MCFSFSPIHAANNGLAHSFRGGIGCRRDKDVRRSDFQLERVVAQPPRVPCFTDLTCSFSSEMASSSYPDIWEISDDEYDEPPFQSSFPSSSQLTVDSNTKNEVVVISDTDSDDDPPPPSSQIPSSSQPHPSSSVAIDLTLSDDDERYDDDELPTFRATALDDDSDSDLPPPELLSQSPRKRRLSQSINNDADASPTKKAKSQSSSPAKVCLYRIYASPSIDEVI